MEALFGLVNAEKITLEEAAKYADISYGDAEELLQGWNEVHDPERMREVRGGDLC